MKILTTFEEYLSTLTHLSQNSIITNQTLFSVMKQYRENLNTNQKYIEGLLEFLKNRMGPNSYNIRLLNLKQFFKWCAEKEIFEYPKYIDKKYQKKIDYQFVVLDEEERELLKNYKGKWQQSAHNFYNMLYTGLHYQDYFNLKDINFQKQHIHNSRQKTGTMYKIPIHESIKESIHYRPYISKAVFNRHLKKIFFELGVDEEVVLRNSKGEFEKRKKCDWITISTARHSFATMALKNNIPHNVIMQWCGWKKPEMIFYYTDRIGIESESFMNRM